jgi:tetratricopeptide (TPR) repeat protein
MFELPAETDRAIQDRCAEGDRLADDGRYAEAIAEYDAAWRLLPEPKDDWNAATWIQAAIADACFFSRSFAAGRRALEVAMTCPQAMGNPFLHLRLGQVLWELGDHDRAATELGRAFAAGGDRIFEDEDPKYLEFVKARVFN